MEEEKQRYKTNEYCLDNGITFESEGGLTSAIKSGFKRYYGDDYLSPIDAIVKKEGEWFDHSDIMTDYFHTAFYLEYEVFPLNKIKAIVEV